MVAQHKELVIPFQLTPFNNISINAILNNIDTIRLMFHTAASSVTMTVDATKKVKSLQFNSSTTGIKSWGGEKNDARLSENNTLQIGGMKWEGISIWENTFSGQNTDGKFGIDLFKGKVLMLDFEKKEFAVSDILPADIKKYQKLRLFYENDMMFLEAISSVNKVEVLNKFLIHSGYSGGILFDDKFVAENHIDDKLKIIGEKELKDSYGNIVKTKKAILPLLKVGKEKLSNVPVGFFIGALGRQKMSIMGADILKRFNIVIDSKREFIYLKSNKLKKEKYSNI